MQRPAGADLKFSVIFHDGTPHFRFAKYVAGPALTTEHLPGHRAEHSTRGQRTNKTVMIPNKTRRHVLNYALCSVLNRSLIYFVLF